MDAPEVSVESWIKVQSSEDSQGVDGYVINKYSDGSLGVGYYQNGIKAIKEYVVWTGKFWKFKYEGPNGSYLRGREERIVKNGPYRDQYLKYTK